MAHDTHLLSSALNTAQARKYRYWRRAKDVLARYIMTLGGVSVVLTIVLIAFYLFYVVLPIFKPATVKTHASYTVPGDPAARSLLYAMEEQREIGLRISDDHKANFFMVETGQVRQILPLPIPANTSIRAQAKGDPSTRIMALGLADGSALLFQHNYTLSYPEDKRLITPYIYYPLGAQPIPIDPEGHAIEQLAVQSLGDETTLVALTDDQRLLLVHILQEEDMLGDAVNLVRTDSELPLQSADILLVKMDIDAEELYLADRQGFVYFLNISDKTQAKLVQKTKVVEHGQRITSLSFLSGGISILVGDSQGQITQWFPVRDPNNNYTLEQVRHFNLQGHPITTLTAEHSRKGFIATDHHGGLGIYHATAHRRIQFQRLDEPLTQLLAIAPRANGLLLENDKKELSYLEVSNEHPEISWGSIWHQVWYESREKPEYIWQSSSASNDFEPKFSLMPLVFGTFKASFYAMLFAIPLAILGAIYTAYFMSHRMRAIVKPTIEIMEALPTVILGFLAGLWLAPFTEAHLPGIFALFLCLPFTILIAAVCWERAPSWVRQHVSEGWEAALLIPVIILTILLSMMLSYPLEYYLFDGDMPLWLSRELGLDFDQRNSLVVGFAMGFAVIPTIFSISEDAIYNVPKHLTISSLALGATPWQTMVRVVLLTASPGIFSAIMIGLGRAVGETMIIVMATGNTAIMEMNIFEGFRALSANIAVEMPESEVGSSHYRILFLAAFILFIVTFAFNTVAEVVRQRLRIKYSSL